MTENHADLCVTTQEIEKDRSQLRVAVWSDTNDSRRPRHWPLATKWSATLLLSAIAFLQPLAETAIAPLEDQISSDLGIKHPFEWILVNSLVLVGIGLSSLFLAPLSELYGRKPVLVTGSISFLTWNAGCGAVNTLNQMLALRVLSGFGASVGDAIAPGVLSDMWPAESRGRAFAVFMAAPLLGTAIGPIFGTYVAAALNWRWVFWITSIASVATVFISLALLPETYEPKIEQSLCRKLDKNNPSARRDLLDPDGARALIRLIGENLQRPLRLLGTQVIILLLGTYMALLYGMLWLFLFVYPLLWTKHYEQESRIASLNYLSFGIGLVAGVNVAGHLNDYIYTYLKKRNNGIGRPEFRVPTMVLGTVCAPIGLFIWGWSGEGRAHWIVPNVGSFVFATGVYVCSACVSVYTIDTYTRYAASAVSTNLVLRSVTAAFFPVFAPYMFEALGFGYGATILAAAFLVIGTGVMCVLWFFGGILRAKSPYCATADGEL